VNLSSNQMAMEGAAQNLSAASSLSTGPSRVLLIGATGFIGSRILKSLQTRTDAQVTILTRRPEALPHHLQASAVFGDLTEPATLDHAVRPMDIVINAASYIGNDPKLARKVNYGGTLSLIRACKGARVGRFLQLSTTAIYGTGPHRASQPWELPYRPESITSKSRAAADQAVLGAGGITIRPNLVYGAGDRWVVPGVIRMFRTLGSHIDDGQALLSLIDVEDLGELVAALALTTRPINGAFHAACPVPTSLANLLAEVERHFGPLGLNGSTSLTDATNQLALEGFRPHQVSMLGSDHHYHSHALWATVSQQPKPVQLGGKAADWYRRMMSSF
jgi:nucleoside-diphosphate-sugar epimerase